MPVSAPLRYSVRCLPQRLSANLGLRASGEQIESGVGEGVQGTPAVAPPALLAAVPRPAGDRVERAVDRRCGSLRIYEDWSRGQRGLPVRCADVGTCSRSARGGLTIGGNVSDVWQPLSSRRGVKRELKREEPFPAHALLAVRKFVGSHLCRSGWDGQPEPDPAKVERIFLRLQRPMESSAVYAFDRLLRDMATDDDLALDVLDILVHEKWCPPRMVHELLDVIAST